MGRDIKHVFARFVTVALLGAVIASPLHDAVASDSTTPGDAADPVQPVRADPAVLEHIAAPAPKGYVDDAARLSFDPPVGWVRAPSTALNPESDPPDPAQELVRFQLRVGDASLYALPIPITSALIRDAGAIITVGIARAGGDMIDLDVDPRADRAEATPVAGFFQIDDERTYEGLHVLTRYYVARATDRRLVIRAVTSEEDWLSLGPIVRASMDSLRADVNGPNAPAAPPPAIDPSLVRPEPASPAPAEPQSKDPSLEIRRAILDRAASLLSTPYVWGGNSPGRGMDCSAYVSWVWSVARYTTESIGWVSSPISKDDLRSGDAMNLTIGRDPEGYGHIRLFEAWANDAHTLVWVFEETPPRAVHRVVVYDDRYQPIRLAGLSNAGAAPLVPAPAPAPEPRFVPTQPRNASPVPQRTYTPRPTRAPIVTRTPVPLGVTPTPRPLPTLPVAAPPTVIPRLAPTSSVRPTPRPSRTPAPTPAIHR